MSRASAASLLAFLGCAGAALAAIGTLDGAWAWITAGTCAIAALVVPARIFDRLADAEEKRAELAARNSIDPG